MPDAAAAGTLIAMLLWHDPPADMFPQLGAVMFELQLTARTKEIFVAYAVPLPVLLIVILTTKVPFCEAVIVVVFTLIG